MLSISNFGVKYGSTTVLENINFSLPAGSVTSLLGPNGIGKSSLLKAISGLTPSSGTVNLDQSINLSSSGRASSIAYMPQDTGATSSLTVLEVILLGKLKSLGLRIPEELQNRAGKVLSEFGLLDLQDRTLDALSGGQRQLVFLAQSLFRNPKVLLLDEPTAALDLRHQLIVLDRVTKHCKENGTIAIAAMHDLSLAARCSDRMICLHSGSIVAEGKPKDVLTTQMIKTLYGVEAEILTGSNGTLHITPLHAIEASA